MQTKILNSSVIYSDMPRFYMNVYLYRTMHRFKVNKPDRLLIKNRVENNFFLVQDYIVTQFL